MGKDAYKKMENGRQTRFLVSVNSVQLDITAYAIMDGAALEISAV